MLDLERRSFGDLLAVLRREERLRVGRRRAADHHDDPHVLRAGVRAFILKSDAERHLIAALDALFDAAQRALALHVVRQPGQHRVEVARRLAGADHVDVERRERGGVGLERLGDQAGAGGLIAVGQRLGDGEHGLLGPEQRDAATGDDTLFVATAGAAEQQALVSRLRSLFFKA